MAYLRASARRACRASGWVTGLEQVPPMREPVGRLTTEPQFAELVNRGWVAWLLKFPLRRLAPLLAVR
jgi:hypothetical protein